MSQELAINTQKVVAETQPNSIVPDLRKGISCKWGLGRLRLDVGKALAARWCCPEAETPGAAALSTLGGFRTWLDQVIADSLAMVLL